MFGDTPQLNVTTKEGRPMMTIFAALRSWSGSRSGSARWRGSRWPKAAGKYAKWPKLTAEQIAEAGQRVDSGIPKAVVAPEPQREPPDAPHGAQG